MRFAPIAFAILALPALAIAPACRRSEPPPPPPPPAAPVSLWGEADSQAIAKQLVEAAASHAWSSQFRDRNGRAARIAVGGIADRSGKAVPVEALARAIAAELTASGGDKLAGGGEDSDFILHGAVGASAGTSPEGAAMTFFSIDLALNERASGDKVWHFAVERPISER